MKTKNTTHSISNTCRKIITQYDLQPIKDILRTFLVEIEAVKKLRQSVSESIIPPFTMQDRLPDFSRIEFQPAADSFWEKDNAYMWIYAEAWHYRSLMQHPKINRMAEYYRQPTQPLYQQWLDLQKEVIYRGEIIPPPGEASLGDYLLQLASMIMEKNEKRAIWNKSRCSFVEFLRKKTPLALQGNLESILPRKMQVFHDYSFQHTDQDIQQVDRSFILRRIDDAIYPIDIWASAEILQNLARVALEGRPNSQHTALEALAFAWICHAIGFSRLMTREKIIHASPLLLKCVDPAVPKTYFQPKYYSTLQTLFGPIDTPISKMLHDFLLALPRVPGNTRIFTKPYSMLLRTLYDKGINTSERLRNLGKITFLTFMSQSHEVFNYRHSPMKKLTNPKQN
jgi:hypothetical protein